jgi:hypothetical protein
MARVVIIPVRTVPLVDHFLAQNARAYHPVMMKMTAAELREAKTKEWAGTKRAWLLAAIERRLGKLALAAELAVILKNARKAAGNRGRLPLTPRQIEARIDAKFNLPDTKANRQRIYELTKKLKERREEWTQKAILSAQAKEQGRLTKRQLREYRQAVGDHDHFGLQEGTRCPLCGEVIDWGVRTGVGSEVIRAIQQRPQG